MRSWQLDSLLRKNKNERTEVKKEPKALQIFFNHRCPIFYILPLFLIKSKMNLGPSNNDISNIKDYVFCLLFLVFNYGFLTLPLSVLLLYSYKLFCIFNKNMLKDGNITVDYILRDKMLLLYKRWGKKNWIDTELKYCIIYSGSFTQYKKPAISWCLILKYGIRLQTFL